MEIKEMRIPEGWECIIEDGVATFREKKQTPPRSWEEFRKRYPVKKNEYCIKEPGYTLGAEADFETRNCITWCTSKEEAEAFLALMQLRQLRKAWVGDWEQSKGSCAGIFYSVSDNKVTISYDNFWTNITLSFPTKEMAEDFLSCFRDLCETAKILL